MYLEQIRPPRAVEQRKDNHMGIKIGINGFGRIGRVVLRILADDPERFDVCGINLRKADVDYMVYLLNMTPYSGISPELWSTPAVT